MSDGYTDTQDLRDEIAARVPSSRRAADRNTKRYRPTDTIGTPRWLFYQLDREFAFTVDVAASDENHLCERYYTLETNGLARDWSGEVVWCNPPYSDIAPWVAKAAATPNATTVMLLPARTEMAWWHEHCWGKADEFRWVRGRLQFMGREGTSPHASVIVVWRNR